LAYQLTHVVVVNWNGKETLRKCLTTFFANTKPQEAKIILVDNGSTDGSVEMLQENFPQIKLMKNQENKGFSIANNQGIRAALTEGAKQILLLNNDIEITNDKWLQTLNAILESDSRFGVVGCKLLYPNGRLQHAGGVIALHGAYHRGEHDEDRCQYDKVEIVDYVTGAVLLIKSKVILEIGLLDEGYSPIYCEDSDWCVRARLYGYKVVYTPEPTLIHHCGVDTAKMGSRKAFFFRKSAIRFYLLNYQIKDILKRLIRYEVPALASCFVRRNRNGKLPLTLRLDAYKKLLLFIKVWTPCIRDLKGIMAKRRQRFMLGAKLHLSK
jgi:GT2 family glycosyltransferase